MRAQSTQNFFWILYTDPHVDADLQAAVVALLADAPHYYLVLDNAETRFSGGADVAQLPDAAFVTGDVAALRAALELRTHPELPSLFLESRLDADDGLHHDYIAHVQDEARVALQPTVEDANSNQPAPPNQIDWMYWCVANTLEWSWVGKCNVSADAGVYGALLPSEDYTGTYCATPGLTLALREWQDYRHTLPSVSHSSLVSDLHKEQSSCGGGLAGTQCVTHVHTYDYPALRSRTPTSAGMLGVHRQTPDVMTVWDTQRGALWALAKRDFSLTRAAARRTWAYLDNHLEAILEDAVDGQCTTGHSCKNGAKKTLDKLLKWTRGNGTEHCEHA
jgi:hypothetical protein